jgi:micrococcal nuclease
MPRHVPWSRTVIRAVLAAAVVGCTAPSADDPVASTPQERRSTASPANGMPVAPFAPTGPTEVGRVVKITDGDTIRAVIDGEEQRVRYIGVDTPESVAPDTPVEPFAKAASNANARLVAGKKVVLERDVSQMDRFDRLLRYVWLAPDLDNGAAVDDTWRLVNLELVRIGLAEAVDYPPDVKYTDLLEAAEAEARAAGRGMWAVP